MCVCVQPLHERPEKPRPDREAAEQAADVRSLIEEAAATYGTRDRITAAADFFTFNVPYR